MNRRRPAAHPQRKDTSDLPQQPSQHVPQPGQPQAHHHHAQALGISFHQIVGGGVVSLTGVAIAMTGGGVPIAYILAAVAIMLVSLPIAYLGAAMPVAGGNYTYATKLLHPLAGFANLLFFVLLMASLSLYGLTAGTYLNSLNPWFDPTVVAVSRITIFAVANLMGAAFSSKLGIYMAFVMLAACPACSRPPHC
ncbi:APC family permease [Pseudarthrobacter sp. P1]|uniref:APC family permease n=1 Tax=Pseudarthrobacter sp. P1 TaxID=3418418 RepID=UPI003CF290BB